MKGNLVNKYQITYLCPSGIYLSIRLMAENLHSARLKAIHQARKFLAIQKGQKSGLICSSTYKFNGNKS